VQTTRLHESFEGSNSSLSCSSGELSLSRKPPMGDSNAFSAIFWFGGKMGFLGHSFGSTC